MTAMNVIKVLHSSGFFMLLKKFYTHKSSKLLIEIPRQNLHDNNLYMHGHLYQLFNEIPECRANFHKKSMGNAYFAVLSFETAKIEQTRHVYNGPQMSKLSLQH